MVESARVLGGTETDCDNLAQSVLSRSLGCNLWLSICESDTTDERGMQKNLSLELN
jgi:hypothetical protein